jgi:hypothetical protein
MATIYKVVGYVNPAELQRQRRKLRALRAEQYRREQQELADARFKARYERQSSSYRRTSLGRRKNV